MFFPALIELARDDSDMNVVQYALYVLQHVLADPDHKRGAEDGSMKEFLELNDFLLDPHGYCLAIEEMGEEKKTGMLSVHPLVLKKFVPADKMYLPIPYLYDVDCDKNYVFPTADDDRLIPLTFSGRW